MGVIYFSPESNDVLILLSAYLDEGLKFVTTSTCFGAGDALALTYHDVSTNIVSMPDYHGTTVCTCVPGKTCPRYFNLKRGQK